MLLLIYEYFNLQYVSNFKLSYSIMTCSWWSVIYYHEQYLNILINILDWSLCWICIWKKSPPAFHNKEPSYIFIYDFEFSLYHVLIYLLKIIKRWFIYLCTYSNYTINLFCIRKKTLLLFDYRRCCFWHK